MQRQKKAGNKKGTGISEAGTAEQEGESKDRINISGCGGGETKSRGKAWRNGYGTRRRGEKGNDSEDRRTKKRLERQKYKERMG